MRANLIVRGHPGTRADYWQHNPNTGKLERPINIEGRVLWDDNQYELGMGPQPIKVRGDEWAEAMDAKTQARILDSMIFAQQQLIDHNPQATKQDQDAIRGFARALATQAIDNPDIAAESFAINDAIDKSKLPDYAKPVANNVASSIANLYKTQLHSA